MAASRPRRIQRQSIFQINDQIKEHIFGDAAPERPYLRPLQREALLALSKIQDEQQSKDPLLIVMPTGSGKSGVVITAPYVLPSPPRKVLVLTPSKIISSQLLNDFGNGRPEDPSFFERIGLYQNDERDDYKPTATEIHTTRQFKDQSERTGLLDLTIVNAQKFSARTKFVDSVGTVLIPADSFDLVIVDEAHHYPAETWKRLVNHFAKVRKIFLTATPNIAAGPILPKVDPLVRFTIDDAVKFDLIRKPEIKELPLSPSSSEERLICQAIHDEIWQRTTDTGYQHQAMILVEDIQRVVAVAATYNEMFPNENGCRGYHSQSRAQIPREFSNNDYQVLVVCGCLLEGYDNPRVSVLGIIRNIARTSVVLFTQFVGRAVRKPSLAESLIEVPLKPALILACNFRNISQYFKDCIREPVLPQEEDVEEEEEEDGDDPIPVEDDPI